MNTHHSSPSGPSRFPARLPLDLLPEAVGGERAGGGSAVPAYTSAAAKSAPSRERPARLCRFRDAGCRHCPMEGAMFCPGPFGGAL